MATIEDLISQIADERLRQGIAAEVKALKKTKKFGLVFEDHLPETVRLPRVPVKVGSIVARRTESGNRRWIVRSLTASTGDCEPLESKAESKATIEKIPIKDLVSVRSFGEPIFPALTKIDSIERGGDAKPWHLLINADNFHALQLLQYCYEGKLDLIYIDPPYNTGARDWKYNNDYVDRNDSFRHSKWLSMMKKRLLLAKRLLSPTGVLVVTIDEHEVHHLGSLLEDVCPELTQQMVTIVINAKGVSQGRFARVEEYALFAFRPAAGILTHHDDLLSPEKPHGKGSEQPRWERLLRGGNNSRREDRPGLFYPIYVDPDKKQITRIGDVLPIEKRPDLSKAHEGVIAWPLRTDGSYGNWQAKPATLRDLFEKGFVKLGGFDKKRRTWTVLYLNRGTRARIESGEINIVGREDSGAVVIEYASEESRRRSIKTVWHRGLHDSGIYGSSILRSLVGGEVKFPFPKSLYAVRDALGAVVRSKKDALILDFFAGSGTTLHATALLNSEDGGARRCILVTNNEVGEDRARELAQEGILPGHEKFERNGIAESITWPRCKAAISGQRADGVRLDGEYAGGRSMADGFEENMLYCRLDFLDPAEVARGDAFAAIYPILWLIAGAVGRPDLPKKMAPWIVFKNSAMAVLLDEKAFHGFRAALSNEKEHVFIVTDSEENFSHMRAKLGERFKCIQLYKSYLETFRLNTPEALGKEL